MSCPSRLSQWYREVSTAFAPLSQPQIWGLVLWSAGMALVGTAGITQISALLASVLHQQEQTVFQRLREWYLDADHTSGEKRRELEVSTCFAPRLSLDREAVGANQPADGAGTRCHQPGRSVDRVVGQCGVEGLCAAGGLESGGRA